MKTLNSIKPIILDRSDLLRDSANKSILAINISDFNVKEELFWDSPLVIFMDGDPKSLVYDRTFRVLKDRHGIFESKENLTEAWKTGISKDEKLKVQRIAYAESLGYKKRRGSQYAWISPHKNAKIVFYNELPKLPKSQNIKRKK